MLDVKGDKSLWDRMNLDGVGKVLLVEESYYDGIIELIQKSKIDFETLEQAYINMDIKKDKQIERLEKINLISTHLMTDKQLKKLSELVNK